jgi:vitamin B12 transporter
MLSDVYSRHELSKSAFSDSSFVYFYSMKIKSTFHRSSWVSSCAAFPLSLLIATPLFAQSSNTQQLNDVVITATRTPTKITDISADVTVIDREELDLAGQSSIIDILSQQAGLQLTRSGSYRSSTGIFLRGATSSQTIILVDGVRVGSATSGVASIENLPLERIERIEILRGAASALYGPDAVGGVIQIFTRAPSTSMKYSANAGVGQDGQRQAGLNVSGTNSGIGYSFGASREQARGISVINNPAASSFNPDEDRFKTTSINAKLQGKIHANHELSLSALHSQSEYQFDGSPYPNPLKLNKLTSDAWNKGKLTSLNFRWQAQWLSNWKSSFSIAQGKEDSITDYFRISDRAFAGSGKFNTDRRQATWQNEIRLGSDLLSITAEQNRATVDSTEAYKVKQRTINSGLVSYALQRGDWNALAAVRSDENSQFGNFTNWTLSGSYQILPGIRAIASSGTSFQAPSFNQLYYPGFGNPLLTPQRNQSNEIGFKAQGKNLNYGAVVYQNEIKGFINPVTNVQSALANLRGVTLNAAWQYGATQLSTTYDYADPRTKPNNLRFVRIARNVMNFRVQHQVQNVNVFSELKFSSDRQDNNLSFNGRTTLGGYGLVNLGATWKVNQELTVLARINNVTNKNYSLANTYSTPGRNAFISATWSN